MKGEYELRKSVLSIIAAILILSTLIPVGGFVSAESIEDLKEKINQHEEEKSKLSDEKGTLDSEQSDTESQINKNLEEQDSVSEEINELDDELAATQNGIAEKENQIETTNQEINELTERIDVLHEEIKTLEDKIEKRDLVLRDRLRSIQQSGGQVRYIEVIFGAKSFGDLISRASAVNTIMDQDQQIMEEQAADKQLLTENKVEVEEKKETVVAKKDELEGQKEELLALEKQLDEQKEDRETLMAELEEEHGELEEVKLTIKEEKQILAAEEKAKAQAIAQAEGKISELEQLAREEEERKRKEEEERQRQEELARQAEQEKAEKVESAPQTQTGSNSTNSSNSSKSSNSTSPAKPTESGSSSGGGNGIFIHPASGGVTSGFGMRNHPIDKIQKFHAGIDYGTPVGTPLRAPADGVVSTSGTMGGFGNVIMISHHINGQDYTTVMAHLSSMNVSSGQSVSQGQVIGATGNTGHSTGPHLHFEVHVGGYGNPVNPVGYLN